MIYSVQEHSQDDYRNDVIYTDSDHSTLTAARKQIIKIAKEMERKGYTTQMSDSELTVMYRSPGGVRCWYCIVKQCKIK